MKKIIFLLSLVLFFSGCTIKKLDNKDINNTIETALLEDNKLSNTNAEGYKYYLLRGMQIADKNDYNTKILYNDDVLYLYVDVIAYYHKEKKDYTESKKAYFSKVLNTDDKHGYIEINEKDNKYLVEVIYNYAKIEAYVKKDSINGTITNALYLLSSITYNDEVLETLIGKNILTYQEETLNILEPQREEGTWLEYDKEYGNYENSTKKDKDKDKDEDILLPSKGE